MITILFALSVALAQDYYHYDESTFNVQGNSDEVIDVYFPVAFKIYNLTVSSAGSQLRNVGFMMVGSTPL